MSRELEMPTVMNCSYGGLLGTSHLDTFADYRIRTPINPWNEKTWPDTTNWENDIQKVVDTITTTKEKEIMGTRRLVKVVIVDPNESVPLEDAILYMGDEQLTDLTDEEIFYDLEIKSILKAHNGKRIGILDKEATKKRDKDVFLEKLRIRDLKMVVLTIAQF